ncbi:MAG: PQQ-binding-like beta-propeller repeat protein [Peptococcaceae bacterium]|nr:PQQ-binding-like beta-propeller repeat protein [Peptococcaceae bacterium]
MCRKLLVSFLTVFFLLAMSTCTEAYEKTSPEIVWQGTRLGKATDLIQGPNGLFYLPSGNKVAAVDDQGQKLWEAALSTGGKKGLPVFDGRGSIFFPGSASIQEVKLNGSNGWHFNVYGDKNNSPMITFGPGNLLYLPLPSGLYALDAKGHYQWLRQQYESGNANCTKIADKREILACAGNSQAVFVVTGKKGQGHSLLALSGEGKILWRHWLGDIKTANLAVGCDGWLYATVNHRLSKGMVYAFNSVGDGSPQWSYSIKDNNLTAPTPSRHGLLYFCAGNELFALDLADGSQVWSVLTNKTLSCPAVDEDTLWVYLGTADSRLLAVTPQGRLDWNLTLDGKVTARPLPGSDGTLYVATDKGSLYKIKTCAFARGE